MLIELTTPNNRVTVYFQNTDILKHCVYWWKLITTKLNECVHTYKNLHVRSPPCNSLMNTETNMSSQKICTDT